MAKSLLDLAREHADAWAESEENRRKEATERKRKQDEDRTRVMMIRIKPLFRPETWEAIERSKLRFEVATFPEYSQDRATMRFNAKVPGVENQTWSVVYQSDSSGLIDVYAPDGERRTAPEHGFEQEFLLFIFQRSLRSVKEITKDAA